jgi:hypothetical protein
MNNFWNLFCIENGLENKFQREQGPIRKNLRIYQNSDFFLLKRKPWNRSMGV